jgi:photosystem II stability/assembly factor-like uncharacterized protein
MRGGDAHEVLEDSDGGHKMKQNKHKPFSQMATLKTFVILAFGLALVSQPAAAAEPYEAAHASALADRALLLDVAEIGPRLVAVGEYGHIIYSDDDGQNWTQAANVPTRNTLTSVTFVDNKTGFAVGHDATILKTEDGGLNWTLKHIERRGENPLFGIHFADDQNGLAVGAFSTVMQTSNGGETWFSRTLIEGSYDDFHLNDLIKMADGTLIIPAEFGTVYKSVNGGADFTALTTPYEGSFWGGMSLQNGDILIWGMRGNAYLSSDSGESWRKSETGSDRSISGGTQLADGTIVLTGLSGLVLVSNDNGKSFAATVRSDRLSFATVSRGKKGTVNLYGDPGVKQHALQ